jgi:PPK2 family polyphosphate:nucleotide phosphotransferase
MHLHPVENEFWVRPGACVSLADYDPADTQGLKKKAARKELEAIKSRLNDVQTLIYATARYGVLVVLQGMDTSGKDGSIRHVMSAFNPQGCQVASFKVPTPLELAHDFLWRVHRVAPPRGMVGIFNRSHYEDVLVARVESLVPEAVWRTRYEAINAFEKLLADSGIVVLKFCLQISKEEQRERLERRLQNPHHHWKFHVLDLHARARWDDYQAAYEEALSRCSTEHAPWYVIPADRKWYRNLVISRILCETLERLHMEWPPLEPEAQGIVID